MQRSESRLERLSHYATRPVTIVLVIAFAIAGLIGWHRHSDQVRQAAARRLACTRDQRLAARLTATRPAHPSRPHVVVLGDGIAEGFGARIAIGQGWPALLARREGWAVTVDARAGTGFVNGGFCRHQRLARRAKQVSVEAPRTVIVEAGTADAQLLGNGDVTPAKLAAAMTKTLHRLRTVPRVVIVGVPARSTKLTTVNHLLHSATRRAGDSWISPKIWHGVDLTADDAPDAHDNALIASRLAHLLAARTLSS